MILYLIIAFVLLLILIIGIYLRVNCGCIIINRTILKYVGSSANVKIPKKVASIGTHAFAENNRIKTVSIFRGIYISNYAFFNCKNLEKIDLIGEMTAIGTINSGAFSGCSSLKEVPLVLVEVGKEVLSLILCKL